MSVGRFLLFSLVTLAAPLSGRAAGSAPGFPKKTGGAINGAAVVADLGEPAIVAVAGNKVVAYGLDGHGIAGFPIDLGPREVAAGDLAAADWDGDHKAELAVATASG